MTTKGHIMGIGLWLWFAQNSLPLWLKWQPKQLLCQCLGVVICSKFITFVVEMTTNMNTFNFISQLWFAQNSLPLWLKWQRCRVGRVSVGRCDLLKIHYLCGWNDNKHLYIKSSKHVVICSKFITFVVEMTTSIYTVWHVARLWFAQNSLPLWLKWQQTNLFCCVLAGCDLLKIHYLCGWNDNGNSNDHQHRSVVICSKFITFVVEMTT